MQSKLQYATITIIHSSHLVVLRNSQSSRLTGSVVQMTYHMQCHP